MEKLRQIVNDLEEAEKYPENLLETENLVKEVSSKLR